MTARSWKNLSEGQEEPLKLSGQANMALDSYLLASSIESREPSYLVRLYGWSEPCLSIGANQSLSPRALKRCRQRGVDVVQRPTGGGAVLHGHDLTYAVVGPDEGKGVLQIYQAAAEALICGLGELGIESSVVEHHEQARATACFAAPTGADLAVNRRKICGSAQLRRGGWFLQHGSIPLEDSSELTAELTESAEANTSAWLSLFCPGITPRRAATALLAGFEKAWGPARP